MKKNICHQFLHNNFFPILSMYQIHIIRRYYVIIYVGHFWPPYFCPISVRSLFICQIHYFLHQSIYSIFHYAGNLCGQVPVDCLMSTSNDSMGNARIGEGKGHISGENFCAGVHVKLFWYTNYCANPRSFSRVPVQLPVPRGTGNMRSADHA